MNKDKKIIILEEIEGDDDEIFERGWVFKVIKETETHYHLMDEICFCVPDMSVNKHHKDIAELTEEEYQQFLSMEEHDEDFINKIIEEKKRTRGM